MLSNDDRLDRNPAAIQQQLMEIDRLMDELQPMIEQQMEAMLTAKVALDGMKSKSQHLKGRAMILQSVLRSLK